MPKQIPSSLRELVDASVLIVHGRITKVPACAGDKPAALETDALLEVEHVIKGSISGREVLFSQRGGTTDGFSVTPSQYMLARTGEEYLLFLVEDRRPDIPDVPRLKRYLVTGIWSGLFLFKNGRVRVETKKPDPFRERFAGLTLHQIKSRIEFAE